MVNITVRTDPPRPKAGQPVAFEVIVSSAAQACCRVELRVGDGASFASAGGFACLPDAAAGTRAGTFRWAHAYERAGRFSFTVTARAGTCSELAATAGITGVIEVG